MTNTFISSCCKKFFSYLFTISINRLKTTREREAKRPRYSLYLFLVYQYTIKQTEENNIRIWIILNFDHDFYMDM